MTEQRFQAPPIPPRAPAFGVQPMPAAQSQVQAQAAPATGNQADLPADNFAAALKLPNTIYRTKVMGGILVGAAVVGILFGAILFGGGDSGVSQKPQGLAGVVTNRDVTPDLIRCGMIAETSACVAYFVNHTRNDKLAEEFFDEAVRQTGRQKYRINIDNPHYAKTRIPPGHIAQIRIPTLN